MPWQAWITFFCRWDVNHFLFSIHPVKITVAISRIRDVIHMFALWSWDQNKNRTQCKHNAEERAVQWGPRSVSVSGCAQRGDQARLSEQEDHREQPLGWEVLRPLPECALLLRERPERKALRYIPAGGMHVREGTGAQSVRHQQGCHWEAAGASHSKRAFSVKKTSISFALSFLSFLSPFKKSSPHIHGVMSLAQRFFIFPPKTLAIRNSKGN